MTQRVTQQTVEPSTLATMHANLASMADLSSRRSAGRLFADASGAASDHEGVMVVRADPVLDLKFQAVALHGALRAHARVLQPTLMEFLR